MGEKVLHPLDLDLLHVAEVVHLVVHRGELVLRHRENLLVLPRIVLHHQHPERPHADDAARHHRPRVHDQHVERIAVAAERMRDEPVVPRIAHRRIEEPVDKQRARGLVELVLDRLAAERHLDHDIDVVGRVLADRDGIEVHGRFPRS